MGQVALSPHESPKAVSVDISFPQAASNLSTVIPQRTGPVPAFEPGSLGRSSATRSPHISGFEPIFSENTLQTPFQDPRVGIGFVLAYVLPIASALVYEC